MKSVQLPKMAPDGALNPRQIMALLAWRGGLDLRQVYTKSTFYRLRREIMAGAGVDIAKRSEGAGCAPS